MRWHTWYHTSKTTVIIIKIIIIIIIIIINTSAENCFSYKKTRHISALILDIDHVMLSPVKVSYNTEILSLSVIPGQINRWPNYRWVCLQVTRICFCFFRKPMALDDASSVTLTIWRVILYTGFPDIISFQRLRVLP